MSRMTKEITWKTGKLKASYGTPIRGRACMRYTAGRGRAGAEEGCQEVSSSMNAKYKSSPVKVSRKPIKMCHRRASHNRGNGGEQLAARRTTLSTG